MVDSILGDLKCFVEGDHDICIWWWMEVLYHTVLEICVRNKPLARLRNLFSVITVILLINMPITFKFDSCKNFATNLNAANSLGLGSKKCSKHFTLNTYRFFIIFSL